MRVVLTVLCVSVLLVGAACANTDDRPGNPTVYAEIAAETDCAALQKMFDRNMDDVERRGTDDPLRDVVFAYAKAADSRMDDLGCYG